MARGIHSKIDTFSSVNFAFEKQMLVERPGMCMSLVQKTATMRCWLRLSVANHEFSVSKGDIFATSDISLRHAWLKHSKKKNITKIIIM